MSTPEQRLICSNYVRPTPLTCLKEVWTVTVTEEGNSRNVRACTSSASQKNKDGADVNFKRLFFRA